MPYKSDAQRRFFHTDTAKKKGITEDEVQEFDKASKGKKLPEKKMAGGGDTENPIIDPAASEQFRDGVKNGINGDWESIKQAILNTVNGIHTNYTNGMGDTGNLTGLQNVANQAAGIPTPIDTSDGKFMGEINVGVEPKMAGGGTVPDPSQFPAGGYPGAGADNAAGVLDMIKSMGLSSLIPGSPQMNQMATGIGQGVTAPGSAGIVNNALGTNLSDTPTQPGTDPMFMAKLNAGTAMTPPSAPSQPTPNPIMQASQNLNTTPSTAPNIYQGISAEDRAALAQKLMAQKASAGSMATSGAGGLADAITSSFGKQPTQFQNNIRDTQNKNMEKRLGTMDTERSQKMQDLQANYAAMEQDPNSPVSQGMRNFLKQNGVPAPSGMNAAMIKTLLPDIAKMFESRTQAAIAAGSQGVESGKALMGETLWEQLKDKLGIAEGAEAGEQYLEKRVGAGTSAPNFTHSTPSGIRYGVK